MWVFSENKEEVAVTPVASAQVATNQENVEVLRVLSERYASLMAPDVAGTIAVLKKCKFLWVTAGADADALLLDVATGLLWDARFKQNDYDGRITWDSASNLSIPNSLQKIQQTTNHGTWRLPSRNEIVKLAQQPGSPYRSGAKFRLFATSFWLVNEGVVNLNEYDCSVSERRGRLLAVNDAFKNNLEAFAIHGAQYGWVAREVEGTSIVDLLTSMKSKPNLQMRFQAIDTRSARLPLLDAAQYSDPNKGLWEFWGQDPQELQKLGVRARNPVADLRDGNVAIDFGTSSTVVAYDDNGTHKLLRIGVTDFYEAVKAAHYENPTVLEFVDIAAMLKPWRAEAYRPSVAWDDVRCSHEALHNFRNNDTKPEVVASVLTKIKQWALREGDGTRVRLTDRKEGKRIEHELAPLTLRQPVKGRALEVCENDPFDPIELYAWFLGLTINWRGRGLFLRYYMTFPVAYQREVKEKVLASFRRGLQRSLPATLVTQPEFEKFVVEERASEPAAYAATALGCLNIEPTPEGVAYAVFDFGGGTTDFDFGYYRLPTEAEVGPEDMEIVFEHFGNGGEKYLGGENLLDHLAYLTFRHNIEVCRKQKIAFTKPQGVQDFPGSELFLDRTQAAATNTLMLVAKLRSFWETGETSNKTGVEKIDLLGRDGKKVPCELSLPFDALNKFLEERIELGIHNFYAALKKAFADELPQQVQVLLAGNASRSKIVQGFFGLLEANDPLQVLKSRTDEFLATLFGKQLPVFTVHPPLQSDESDVYRPTGKTGVALGLLRLCPGSSTLVINHATSNAIGDASFLHYIGRIRMSKFHVCLPQGAPYQKWVELGPVRERVFYLIHSQESRAHLGEMKEGESGLQQRRIDLAGSTTGLRVYGRAVSPHEIELCTAASVEAAENGQFENLRKIKLG